MPSYTDYFHQRARTALTAAGYPNNHGSLITVSRLLNVPCHTLKRWFHQSPPAPTTHLIVQPMIMREMQSVFDALDRKRDTANYAQLSHALSQLMNALQQAESVDHA